MTSDKEKAAMLYERMQANKAIELLDEGAGLSMSVSNDYRIVNIDRLLSEDQQGIIEERVREFLHQLLDDIRAELHD